MSQTITALAPVAAPPADAQTRIASLPFSGFYNSVHDANLDRELEQMFADDNGEPFWGLIDRAHGDCRWHSVHVAYAKAYTEKLCEECDIKGAKIHSLDRPREYNFRSDEIDVTFPLAELRRMLAHVERETLRKRVAERLKPRSGFIPFYSDNLEAWGDLETWEAPQLSILVEVYCDEFTTREQRDCWLMDDFSGNGHLTSWIENATPNVSRLYDIREYLERRAGRCQS